MKNCWTFKTISDNDRTYKSHNGYNNVLTSKYVYDNKVANSRQVTEGDYVILVDKEFILGYAKISTIKSKPGKKKITRCPICNTTNYEKRKTKLPEYRCNKGHEFSKFKSETIDIISFQANYEDSFIYPETKTPISVLKKYYHRNYNRNMSIQNIDPIFLTEINESVVNKLDNYFSNEEETQYTIEDKDNRDIINMDIKARRGQPKFRKILLDKFQQTCCITGCSIVDILEAAHIKPYRGEKDNHPNNGLLLRADIHTLFDLNLIGINPKDFTIHLCPTIAKNGYEILEGEKVSIINSKNISLEALEYKWNLFFEK